MSESSPGRVLIEGDDLTDPAAWAVQQLTDALRQGGVQVVDDDVDVLISLDLREDSALGAEGFTFARPDASTIVVTASDPRGLAYGVAELADRVTYADDPLAELRAVEAASEHAATAVRSILRSFSCEVEDKPWLYDQEFWTEYLTELATNRVNRIHLAFGMAYNYGHHPANDNYLCFPYPFLLDVPGFDVRPAGLSDEERARNLDAVRFASDEAKRRGIHFQLGLWNHAYDQGDGSHPTYPIEGLTPETHAEYCGSALKELLRACPSIAGVTIRVHYEGGVPEPGHDFWRVVMGRLPEVGRTVELDMHSKGVDEGHLEIARASGGPVLVSAKYWAEHQGLPYHQTTIREREKATKEPGTGLMAITAHQRRFTRYGYGDFLREGSDFGLLFRIWPGTQKVLLWGDPTLAAGYGRLGTLGGAVGIELCEPLTFKGRKGTGTLDGRDPYADAALRLEGKDWRKYRYTYRLWGRLLYDPDAAPAGWRRFLRAEYGAAADSVEKSLGAASRVLPLVTTVHGLGASNNGYWPEMYVNMPILPGGPNADHYERDTAAPTTFGGVSSFDPTMFANIDSYADDLLAGRRDGRYTPDEVASWLDALAEVAERQLDNAREEVDDPVAPAFRRLAVDVMAQAGLARFFAGKFRAGRAYALFERTKDASQLVDAVDEYRRARDAYAGVADVTGVYRDDLTFGDLRSEHGHWSDRLPAIEADLGAMERLLDKAKAEGTPTVPEIPSLPPRGPAPSVSHVPPTPFAPGEPVRLLLDGFGGEAVLHYRHLNQGEDFETVAMTRVGDRLEATIPASYTNSVYALVYFFTLRSGQDAWIVPGLDATFANQPYHVLRQKG